MTDILLDPLQCPGCKKTFRVKAEAAGRKIKCRCGTILEIPEPEPENPVFDAFDELPWFRKANLATWPILLAMLSTGFGLCPGTQNIISLVVSVGLAAWIATICFTGPIYHEPKPEDEGLRPWPAGIRWIIGGLMALYLLNVSAGIVLLAMGVGQG